MEAYHCKIIYRGRVQGVGFRYQTLDVARGYEVSGFVHNEADGSVTLEVEGEQVEVEDFIQAVSEELSPFIRETETQSCTRERQFRGFLIT